jgi:hypothetical protein
MLIINQMAQYLQELGGLGAPLEPSTNVSFIMGLLMAFVSPASWILFTIIWMIMAFSVIDKKDGSHQWKKAALYSLIPHLVIAVPMNMFFVNKILPNIL